MSERRRSELERPCSGFGMRDSVHVISPLQQGENVEVQRSSWLKEGFLVMEKMSRLGCWEFGGTGAQSLAEESKD